MVGSPNFFLACNKIAGPTRALTATAPITWSVWRRVTDTCWALREYTFRLRHVVAALPAPGVACRARRFRRLGAAMLDDLPDRNDREELGKDGNDQRKERKPTCQDRPLDPTRRIIGRRICHQRHPESGDDDQIALDPHCDDHQQGCRNDALDRPRARRENQQYGQQDAAQNVEPEQPRKWADHQLLDVE